LCVTLIRKLQSTLDLDHFHARDLRCSRVKSCDDPISDRREILLYICIDIVLCLKTCRMLYICIDIVLSLKTCRKFVENLRTVF